MVLAHRQQNSTFRISVPSLTGLLVCTHLVRGRLLMLPLQLYPVGRSCGYTVPPRCYGLYSVFVRPRGILLPVHATFYFIFCNSRFRLARLTGREAGLSWQHFTFSRNTPASFDLAGSTPSSASESPLNPAHVPY